MAAGVIAAGPTAQRVSSPLTWTTSSSAICFAGAKNELASLASKAAGNQTRLADGDLRDPHRLTGRPGVVAEFLDAGSVDVDIGSIVLRGGLTTLAPIIATGITRRNCPRRTPAAIATLPVED